jgi:hypothetical protein
MLGAENRHTSRDDGMRAGFDNSADFQTTCQAAGSRAPCLGVWSICCALDPAADCTIVRRRRDGELTAGRLYAAHKTIKTAAFHPWNVDQMPPAVSSTLSIGANRDNSGTFVSSPPKARYCAL